MSVILFTQADTPWAAPPPPYKTATAADSTHPIEMHFCVKYFYAILLVQQTFYFHGRLQNTSSSLTTIVLHSQKCDCGIYLNFSCTCRVQRNLFQMSKRPGFPD